MHSIISNANLCKLNTCPMMTSETSVPFNPALIRLSLITILPISDAFKVDKLPQNDPTE